MQHLIDILGQPIDYVIDLGMIIAVINALVGFACGARVPLSGFGIHTSGMIGSLIWTAVCVAIAFVCEHIGVSSRIVDWILLYCLCYNFASSVIDAYRRTMA
jgi:hypothetical protein